MSKIQKNDEVIVIAGKDKGKKGIVQKILNGSHAVVSGVNAVKKAQKPNPAAGITGGIVDKLMPIHISNVALFNSELNKADRIGYKFVDGKKVRVFKSNGKAVNVSVKV